MYKGYPPGAICSEPHLSLNLDYYHEKSDHAKRRQSLLGAGVLFVYRIFLQSQAWIAHKTFHLVLQL
jgi:hypothetical protein